jgi:hypothetical protein
MYLYDVCMKIITLILLVHCDNPEINIISRKSLAVILVRILILSILFNSLGYLTVIHWSQSKYCWMLNDIQQIFIETEMNKYFTIT